MDIGQLTTFTLVQKNDGLPSGYFYSCMTKLNASNYTELLNSDAIKKDWDPAGEGATALTNSLEIS